MIFITYHGHRNSTLNLVALYPSVLDNEVYSLWSCLLLQNVSSLVQFSQSCLTLCDPMDCSTPGFPSFTNSQSVLKLMSIESVMPSNHLIPSCLLLLPSIFPSIGVFSYESVLHIRWPKYWSFSFSISPSSEYSGLISFRMDWLGLLAVQGTLKSLLQHHSLKASILWCQPSLRSNSHICTWLMEKPWSWLDLCWQSKVSAF